MKKVCSLGLIKMEELVVRLGTNKFRIYGTNKTMVQVSCHGQVQTIGMNQTMGEFMLDSGCTLSTKKHFARAKPPLRLEGGDMVTPPPQWIQ